MRAEGVGDFIKPSIERERKLDYVDV